LPPIYVGIPQIRACSGDTIIVPIVVTNFKQVCSFYYLLHFDNTLMSYAKFSNKNAIFLPDTSLFSVTSIGNSVYLSFSSTTPRTLTGSAVLVNLKFVTSQLFANSPLTWVGSPTCFNKNCNSPPGNLISTVFNNSTVSVNALPQSHNVTTTYPAGGHFCVGSNGVAVGLDLTQLGINYTLYRDGNPVAPHINWPGNGFGYTFGLFTTPGQYRVLAQNPATTCSKWMDGWVDVIADPQLTLFSVTGGGSYCTGGVGQPIGLSGSQTGVDYTLNLNGTPDSTMAGTGSALSFGNQLTPGTYTITARYNGWETCPTTMSPSVTISISPYPVAAGTISGPATVCQGPAAVTFSVPPVSYATSYSWTLPPGATGTSSTNSIAVTFPPGATSGNVTVKGHNVCGDGGISTLAVTVNPLPSTPAAISGLTTVCQGAQGVIYSIPPIPNATSYTWSLPNSGNGWTLASTTADGTGITVNVANNAATGTLTVKGVNTTCGDGPTASLVINISPLPAAATAITGGPTSPCQGQCYNYSTSTIANSTSYEWALPPGATGSSVTNTINICYSTTATNGNVTVNGRNSCGAGVSYSLPVTLSLLPGPVTLLNGPASVCKNTNGVVYSVPPVANATSYVWTFPPNVTGTVTTNLPTNTLNFPATATSGNITVKGKNLCGDGPVFTFPVTVNPLPTVTLGSFSAVCSESTAFTLTGGSPAGGTYSGNAFITNGVFNPQAAGVGTFNIVYTYNDANNCQNSATKTIQVSLFPRITGVIKYDNTPQTPLGNVWVIRKTTANVVIDSTISQIGAGVYWFRCLTSGTYNLSARTSIPWAGSQVNATDAMLIAQAGVGLITLSTLRYEAGDVNNSGTLNAADALIVMRRFVGLLPSYTIADWQFEMNSTVVVTTGDATRNITAICAGDVNGSYAPSGVKTTPSVFLEKKGLLEIPEGEVFDLPIRAKVAFNTNAISFVLNYPENELEVLQVKSKLNGFIYNITDGQIRIAWYGLQPIEFETDEPLFTLVTRMRNSIMNTGSLPFNLDPVTELAGQDGKALMNTKLLLPDVKMADGNNNPPASAPFYLGTNHPNPFSNKTDIDYSLSTDGMVRLSILNILGEEIKVIVSEFRKAGRYQSSFDGNGYSPGIYLYRLEVSGEKDHFFQTKPMVIKD
ncbi:MAG: dockerin type I domain-containing protein, partial [Bacteroidetes bacterium]|nr:dockerin type I domain-containing protein [Bacteroidota bacterium]